ncbi:putative HTH-type transcriptional regulator [Paenibacillus solanacearum]|uniref:HTH-type transcriptional regulator n=1 Tax=Paenibacillus solanacearum TaxID=2048548 RepID=A0A916NL39_9BACL|nr:AraC family transcriptional regulator [Paenibacillus solanacearum]CAG7646085.1 putative HTH-type transcriptional regulator [Paenibacillus solanacearum]
MKDAGVAASMVYPIMKTLVRKGVDTGAFCRYVSFDERLLQDAEARIPAEELERLMLAAAAYTEDEHFGLYQGQVMEFVDLGILGYVMMHSPTIADALDAYERYNAIVYSGFQLTREVQGDDLLLRLFLQHSRPMSRHCVEDMAASVYHLILRLSDRRIGLRGVQFAHDAPSDASPYVPVFGLAPQFGCEGNILRMSAEVLAYPVLYSDAKLLRLFESIAQETEAKLTQSGLFSQQIVRWIQQCIPLYVPSLQQTAESFRTSPRTLQNKLKLERTSFNDLSAKVRMELAMSYLKRQEYSVGEIAYALHYSEPSAFQSAFKKWTGITPGQYRAQAKQGRSGVNR